MTPPRYVSDSSWNEARYVCEQYHSQGLLVAKLNNGGNEMENRQFDITYKGWQVEIWRYEKGFSYRRKRTSESDAEWRYCCDEWPNTNDAVAAAKSEIDFTL